MEKNEEGKEKAEEANDTPKTPSMLEEVTEKIRQLRLENERSERIVSRLEELKSFEALGGSSEGRPQDEKKKEDTDEEYADKALRGEISQE